MGFDSLRLSYSLNGGASYTPVSTLYGNPSSYLWTVPQVYLNHQASFGIVATDSMGNAARIASQSLFTVSGDSIAGTFAAGWNLVGSAVKPSDSTVAAVFGDDIAEPFYMFGYSRAAGYTKPTVLDHGRGYWLGLLTPQTVDAVGRPTTDSAVVPLEQGFNIVSNPLVVDVSTSSLLFRRNGAMRTYQTALDSGWIAAGLTRYNNSLASYEITDTLKMREGCWIGVLVDGLDMVVKPPMHSGTPLLPTPVVLASHSAVNDWLFGLTAELGNVKDQGLFFGINQAASAGFDPAYDVPKAPRAPVTSYIESYYSEPTWAPVLASKFIGNVVAPTDLPTWSFFINSTDNGAVTLRWDAQALQNTVPTTVSLMLRDNSTATTIDMRNQSSYTYDHTDIRSFSVVATVTSSGSDAKLPTTYSLGQNFPNPFNPSTTIRFALPRLSHVSLRIYNPLGQEVATLADGEMNAGYHELRFDATALASGVYLYRLQTEEFVETRKLVLVK